MLFKALIIVFMIVIVYCLGSGLYFLTHDKMDSPRLAKALTWRISLSILLFVLLFVAYALGWITPHAV